jgi:drug/metabolite transporter (DMT)-like permease
MKPLVNLQRISNADNPRQISVILMIVTALLWSLAGLAIKSVEWNPMGIAGARSAIAAIVLLVANGTPGFNWSFPQVGGAITYGSPVQVQSVRRKAWQQQAGVLLLPAKSHAHPTFP